MLYISMFILFMLYLITLINVEILRGLTDNEVVAANMGQLKAHGEDMWQFKLYEKYILRWISEGNSTTN